MVVASYALIQTVAAVVTALSALGIFGLAIKIFRLAKEHDRVLFGEDSVQGWDGIVPMVQRNRECIEQLKDDVPADD